MQRLAVLIALVTLTACQSAGAADQPNFVFLVSEDNTKHFVRLYNPTGAPMPNVEALAKHGLVFNHAFSNAPVCSTARTTLATSCYGPRIGTQYHRRDTNAPEPDGVRHWSALLRAAGYHTANRSKTDYNTIWANDFWHDSSRKATWRDREPGQPFFFMISLATTHEGTLHFNYNDMQSNPTQTDPDSVTLWPQHPDTPVFRYTYARYQDNHVKVDEQFGQVIRQLEEDGLLEDTFVFYFGDHGGVVAGSKGYAYEVGLHVPLVVRVPENYKHLVDADYGDRVDGFVSFVDFGPTLLHLAGVKPPRGIDGQPFLGKGIAMDEVNARDEAFGYADRFDEKYDLVRTYRKGNLKYMRSYQPFNIDGLFNQYRYRQMAFRQWRQMFEDGELSAVQSAFFKARAPEALYDLSVDPFETKNLADDPAYAEQLAEMRQGLRDWVKGMPDLSFYPEPVQVEQAMANPVRFGQSHKRDISKYVDIADLQLVPFGEAKRGIAAALASRDPWQRYWGLITCSAFGEEAEPFADRARELAANDPEPLVRTRAAEYLALIMAEPPQEVIAKALADADSRIEAVLILNTAALLHDVNGDTFTLTAPRQYSGDRWVSDRIKYVAP